MLTNEWKLKLRKKDGEPTIPFDLAGHQAKSITKILKNDFADYFTDTVQMFGNDKRIGEYTADFFNKKYNILFVHDEDCKTLNDFTNRYKRRIENFRKLLNGDTPLLFVYNARKDLTDNVDTAEEIAELKSLIMSKVKNKNSRFIVITPYPLDIKDTSIYWAKRPTPDYNWWVPHHRRTFKGVMYERGIMDFILSETKAMVKQDKQSK